MAIYKYALLTEIENNNYEVFHTIRLSDVDAPSLIRINKFEELISEGKEIIGMNVTDILNVKFGSVWNGSEFINEPGFIQREPSERPVASHAILSDNTVVFILGFEKDSLLDNKFKAAFSGKIMIKNITDYPNSILGWIWNGTELLNPIV